MKRVLLINPARNYIPGWERKVCTQPLGLLHIAAATRAAGYQVRLLDMTAEAYDLESSAVNGFVRYGMSPETLQSIIEEYNPDVAGIGCVQSLQLYEAYEAIDTIKRVNPSIVTVFGGGHASAMYVQEVTKPEVDYVIVGEGELSFVKLLERLEHGHLHGETLPGVAYFWNNQVVFEANQEIIDLDRIPTPAWDLLNMEHYRNEGAAASSYGTGAVAIMQTSRGCPHTCLHCPKEVVFGKSYRRMNLDRVISEILLLRERYGIEEVCIEDSNFTIDRQRVMAFCEKIRENRINMRFSLPHGIEINSLDEEMLELMRDSGFYALHLSIESVNDAVLKTQDKILIKEKITHIISYAKRLGLKVTGYFMIGFPDETLADIEQTIDFAQTLLLDKANFFIFTPLPGTELYERCKEEGLFIEQFDITHLRYAKANINTRHATSEQIQQLRISAWQRTMNRLPNQDTNK